MKSFIVCLVTAFAVLHCAAADSLPTLTYQLDFGSGIAGALALVSNLVGDIIAKLGVAGVADLLNGFVNGLSGAVGSLLDFGQIQQYVTDLVSALVNAGAVTQLADGLLQVVNGATGLDITNAVDGLLGGLGGLLGGLVGGIADALVGALNGVVGGLINGLIGGVSAVVSEAVGAINEVLGLTKTVSGLLSCAASQCLGL
jgi:hypothetical protein